MILCFAGSDATPAYNDIIKEVGGTGRLESFHSLGQKKPPSNKEFPFHVLDSGGFVARTKGVPINVSHYAHYINIHKCKYAFNLDTNDVDETLQNQKYLEENTAAYIIPIYHLSDYLDPQWRDLLNMFAEKYPYISCGGIAGEGSARKWQHVFYKHVFSVTKDKVKVHGLGITSKSILEMYPWFSVDSTSWLSSARFGNSKLHSNKMVSAYYAKNNHYLHNTLMEAEWWVKLEKYITKLWKLRGIEWSE